MLLNNQFLLINKLKISLLFDNDVSKSFIISVNDIVGVRYKYRNNEEYIKGKVDKISCNFNSSIGRIESSIFIKIDGSEEYTGKVKFIKPEQITDLNVFEVADTVINPVVSVDNDTQRVLMIRENELGLFQYSKDGLTWASAGEGPQGLSAYEVAVKFGFEGSEQMWLESLKGRKGNTGAKGADGKSTYQIALDNGFVGIEEEWLESLKGEKGDIGTQGIDGKSAYQVAVRKGFTGTEEEWLESLKGEKGNTGDGGKSAYQIAVENGFNGTETEWLESLKGDKGNTGSKGAAGKSAYAIALDNGFVGTEEEWISSLKGEKGEDGTDGKSAYQIAVNDGYQGTEQEWVLSLKGAKGEDGEYPIIFIGENGNWKITIANQTIDTGVRAQGPIGESAIAFVNYLGDYDNTLQYYHKDTNNNTDSVLFNGNRYVAIKDTIGISPPIEPNTINESWALMALKGAPGKEGINGQNGIDGKSAYQVAKDNGFIGTEDDWLASLKGKNGIDGKSAYQVAVEKGFIGTEAEWIVSIKGKDGIDGEKGIDGSSAYQIAIENGFVGTEQQWIASLKGDSAILNMSFSEQFTGRYDPYGDKIYIRTFSGVTNGTTNQPGPLLISGIKRLWGYSGTIGVPGNRQVIGGYIAVSTSETFPYTAFPRIVDNDVYLYHYFTKNSLDFDIELTYTKI